MSPIIWDKISKHAVFGLFQYLFGVLHKGGGLDTFLMSQPERLNMSLRFGHIKELIKEFTEKRPILSKMSNIFRIPARFPFVQTR